jgi:hypothetical protein
MITRLRPRFSLRTVAVIVALVCAYFGALDVTKRHASHERVEGLASECLGPLLIQRDHLLLDTYRIRRQYFIWLIVFEFKLPFERECHWAD